MTAGAIARCPQCDLLHPQYPVCPFASEQGSGSAPAAGERTATLEPAQGLEGSVIGAYRVGGVLASGGMGTVYRAEHVALGRAAAVKVLRTRQRVGAAERLRREARALSRLRHRNVVSVLDAGELADGTPYLVMELLDGETLAERLERHRVLEPSFALRIAADVLSGLSAAHALGIVHRDVTPRNVLLAREGGGDVVAKLLDFGLAKVVSDVALTGAGEVLGTPHYLAPEQARGERNLGPAADLWGVGVALYESLTGVVPFDGPNVPSLLIRVLTEAPAPPSRLRRGLPAAIDELVLRALAKDPGARLASAELMREAVLQVAESLDPLASTAHDDVPPTLPETQLDDAETLQQQIPPEVLEAFERARR